MLRSWKVCGAGWLMAVVALAQEPDLLAAPETVPVIPALERAMTTLTSSLSLDGAALTVVRADGELHRSAHGRITSDTVLPIASASKWLAVATILTLVDDGTLDLDVPVSRYLAEFSRADKSTVTLRQCLANTAGFPAAMPTRGRADDMKSFAALAADQPLRANPGLEFRYGGVGFQVAACAAERASGKDWHTLFQQRIAAPLGMRDTKFGTLTPPGGDAGSAKLPWVAGGAVSTLRDYGRFVQMLVAQGRHGDRVVLKPDSVVAMMRDQVPDRTVVHLTVLDDRVARYGLGTWLEPIDGAKANARRASDPGAFGFTPWIDLDLGVGGVLAVQDRVGRVLPRLRALQAEVRNATRAPVLTGFDETVTLSHGGRERRYRLHVPPRRLATDKLPVLVVLHGGGGDGEQVAATTGFVELAQRHGFVAVFPDGTGRLKDRLLTWNSGGIRVFASEQNVDDVGFLRAVVRDVGERTGIDPDRVYAAGHSNGAMMCHRLAREAADVFAAIACVSGAMNFIAKDAASPLSVLLIHGTADEHVRYDGGRPGKAVGRAGDRSDASVQDAIDYYRRRNDLAEQSQVHVDGKVRTETWQKLTSGAPAPARLQVITLDGGGHSWPGAAKGGTPLADEPFPFAASAAIWEFVQTARRQPAPQPVPPGAPR